jgi:hypothetical protein
LVDRVIVTLNTGRRACPSRKIKWKKILNISRYWVMTILYLIRSNAGRHARLIFIWQCIAPFIHCPSNDVLPVPCTGSYYEHSGVLIYIALASSTRVSKFWHASHKFYNSNRLNAVFIGDQRKSLVSNGTILVIDIGNFVYVSKYLTTDSHIFTAQVYLPNISRRLNSTAQ